MKNFLISLIFYGISGFIFSQSLKDCSLNLQKDLLFLLALLFYGLGIIIHIDKEEDYCG